MQQAERSPGSGWFRNTALFKPVTGGHKRLFAIQSALTSVCRAPLCRSERIR
jgi:hypothetical protein